MSEGIFESWEFDETWETITFACWSKLNQRESCNAKASNCFQILSVKVHIESRKKSIQDKIWIFFFFQEKLCQIVLPFLIGGVGLIFYITRFPEKMFRAGSVDILGSSHQVKHNCSERFHRLLKLLHQLKV